MGSLDPYRDARRVVVSRLGAIGDTVVCFPALARLRELCPKAQITTVGRTEVFQLAFEDGLCDAVQSPDAVALWKLPLPEPDVRLEGFWRGTDLWLDLDGSELPDECWRRRGIGARIAFLALPPAGWTESASRWVLDRLGETQAPAFIRSRVPRTPPSGAPRIAIAPGAGSLRKRAPAAWFDALARAVRARGARPILVAGEADGDAVEELMRAGTPWASQWLRMPLPELARELRACTAFVANDSGVAHLAAWLSLPGIVRFVASDPRVWAPASPSVRAIGAGTAEPEMPPERAADLLL